MELQQAAHKQLLQAFTFGEKKVQRLQKYDM